jgi:hypothetical protein
MKKRYSATVIYDKQFKGFCFVITDNKTGNEVFRKGEYSVAKSAWRGFRRSAKSLFQLKNIEIVK